MRYSRWWRVLVTVCMLCMAAVLTSPRAVSLCDARILSYNVARITHAQQATLPSTHWSVYRVLDRDTCERPFVSGRNSAYVEATGFTSPFYHLRAHWRVSPLGYVTPARSAMCEFFCHDTAPDTLYGSYFMDTRQRLLSGDGGDWPMVAVYLADMSAGAEEGPARSVCVVRERDESDSSSSSSSSAPTPASSSSSSSSSSTSHATNALWYSPRLWRRHNVTSITVDYHYDFANSLDGHGNRSSSSSSSSSGGGDASSVLDAQVQLYVNGTIVLRYARVPSSSSPALVRSDGDSVPRTWRQTALSSLSRCGAVLSRGLRIVLPTPSQDNDMAAYRLDPVYDSCSEAAYSSDEHGGSSSSSDGSADDAGRRMQQCVARSHCGWCNATSTCMATLVATEWCPTTQFVVSEQTTMTTTTTTTTTTATTNATHTQSTDTANAAARTRIVDKYDSGEYSGIDDSTHKGTATATAGAQVFYDVRITTYRNANSLYNLAIEDMQRYTGGDGGGADETTLQVPLRFRFPFFATRDTPRRTDTAASTRAAAAAAWPLRRRAHGDNSNSATSSSNSSNSSSDTHDARRHAHVDYAATTAAAEATTPPVDERVVAADANADNTTTVYIQMPSIITFDGPVGDCNPLWHTCVNGNYSRGVVLPLQTAAMWTRQTTLEFGYWPADNTSSNVFCDMQPCSKGWVLRVKALTPMATTSRAAVTRVYSFVLYLDESGAMDVVYVCDAHRGSSPYDGDRRMYTVLPGDVYAYPPVLAGVLREGVADAASVRVPPSLIACDTRIRYTPRTRCRDCGVHGRCDESTGTCVCTAPYAGPQCRDCAEGYFKGKTCMPCPRCVNNGICTVYGSVDDDDAAPVCACPAGYGGVDCGVRCTASTQQHIQQSRQSLLQRVFASSSSASVAARATNATVQHVDDANTLGGGGEVCRQCSQVNTLYCDCVTCHCKEGWAGPLCETAVERDVCAMRSLDGCPACTLQEGCAYCSDYACYTPQTTAPGEAAGGRWHTCSYDVRTHEAMQCSLLRPYDYAHKAPFDYLVLLLPFIGLLTVIAFTTLVMLCVMTRRRRALDPHTLVAVNAAVNYRPPPRTRVVARMSLIPPTSVPRGRYVTAIPLRQVPLDVLYARQQAAQRASSANDKHK